MPVLIHLTTILTKVIDIPLVAKGKIIRLRMSYPSVAIYLTTILTKVIDMPVVAKGEIIRLQMSYPSSTMFALSRYNLN